MRENKNLKEDIIELYLLADRNLALRYFGVASRLGSDSDETRETMHELVDEGILYRQSGYYYLNPSHLWKTQQKFVEKFK